VEPREIQKQEPKSPEPRKEEQKLKRFRIVKLEERIAPVAGKGPYESLPTRIPIICSF
jgi:hypothetical protein